MNKLKYDILISLFASYTKYSSSSFNHSIGKLEPMIVTTQL